MAKRKPPGRKKAVGPKKLSPAHRIWVATMVETGGDAIAAAAAAGLSVSQSRHLHTAPEYEHVQQALAEALAIVTERAIETAAWDKESLIEKFADIGTQAIAARSWRAAVQAFSEIGKLLGLYTTKVDHKGKMTWTDLVASCAEELANEGD